MRSFGLHQCYSTALHLSTRRRQLYPVTAHPTNRRRRPDRVILSRLRIWLSGEPGVLPDKETLREFAKMPKAGFYAVKKGFKPGVYTTWAECEAQVKGFAGAAHKKFASRQEAEAFIACESSKPYAKSQLVAPKTKQNHQTSVTTSESTSARDLPTNLAELAKAGFTITPTKPHHLVVYTDGSSRGNGKTGARAGLGVWWSDQRPASKHNLAERLPGEAQTNNRGELLAIIRAIEVCPYPDLPLEIRTDSKYSMSCMTVFLPKWLKNGFQTPGAQPKPVKNKELILHLLALLHKRGPLNGVKFKHVAAHRGEVGNEGADRLANQGAYSAPVPDRKNWLVPDDGEDVQETEEPVDVEIEVDENWLMSPEELMALEREL